MIGNHHARVRYWPLADKTYTKPGQKLATSAMQNTGTVNQTGLAGKRVDQIIQQACGDGVRNGRIARGKARESTNWTDDLAQPWNNLF